jgi:chemotaxis protein CheD
MSIGTMQMKRNSTGTLILGVGEWGISQTPGESVKTYGLGSCVAVICNDTSKQMVGMVHIALPDSSLAVETVAKRPGYCADTGLTVLFEGMQKFGSTLKPGLVQIKLVGGASILDPNGTFNIGKRNVLTIKKLLWGRGLGPIAEEIGGTISRTVSASVDTGAVLISTPGMENRTI